MKFFVKKSLVYDGQTYEVGKVVDIQEKSIIKSCLERELIEEIIEETETETKEPEMETEEKKSKKVKK